MQIQKAAFLLTRNVPSAVTKGPNFNFAPYDYGPFDSDVYAEVSALADAGLAAIAPSGMGRWHTYAATQEGVARGQEVMLDMDERTRKYISGMTDWVRAQGFGSLVRSIYEAYPECGRTAFSKVDYDRIGRGQMYGWYNCRGG